MKGTAEVIDALNKIREEFDLDYGDSVLIFGALLAQMVDDMRASEEPGSSDALEVVLEALPSIADGQTAWVEAAIRRRLCGRRVEADMNGRPS